MSANDGHFLEKLVLAIEQSISPEAVVEQNVYLPILNSDIGATAQCDIVIRTGKKPRETITIIEVQDRNKAVDINDFRGWQQKLVDVGAQHLYCVSRKPFSESIKEKAAKTGNTIKLITLRQLDETQIPINFFEFTFIYDDVDVLQISKKKVLFPTLQKPGDELNLEQLNNELKFLKTNDLKFSIDKENLIALSTICIKNIFEEKDVITRTDTLDLGNDDQKPLYYFSNGQFNSIQLQIDYTWSSKKIQVPVSILSYDQDDHGVLAWVLESFYESSRGSIWFKIPVTKNEDAFSLTGIFVIMPPDMEFSIKLEKNHRSDLSS